MSSESSSSSSSSKQSPEANNLHPSRSRSRYRKNRDKKSTTRQTTEKRGRSSSASQGTERRQREKKRHKSSKKKNSKKSKKNRDTSENDRHKRHSKKSSKRDKKKDKHYEYDLMLSEYQLYQFFEYAMQQYQLQQQQQQQQGQQHQHQQSYALGLAQGQLLLSNAYSLTNRSPSPRAEESNFLQYPPSSYYELRCVLLEYMASSFFDYPIHAQDLYEQLIDAFKQHCQVPGIEQLFVHLDIHELLQEFEEKRAITLEKQALGTKYVEYITFVRPEKIKYLSREFYKDRPKIIAQQYQYLVAASSGSTGSVRNYSQQSTTLKQGDGGLRQRNSQQQLPQTPEGPSSLPGQYRSAPMQRYNSLRNYQPMTQLSMSSLQLPHFYYQPPPPPPPLSHAPPPPPQTLLAQSPHSASKNYGSKGGYSYFPNRQPSPPKSQLYANGAAHSSAKGKEIESLLQQKVGIEKILADTCVEIGTIMNRMSPAEEMALTRFRNQAQKIDFCNQGTRERCRKSASDGRLCEKAHFRRIIREHTDESLGNCSYLDTCRHMDFCRYVHYELDIGGAPDGAYQYYDGARKGGGLRKQASGQYYYYYYKSGSKIYSKQRYSAAEQQGEFRYSSQLAGQQEEQQEGEGEEEDSGGDEQDEADVGAADSGEQRELKKSNKQKRDYLAKKALLAGGANSGSKQSPTEEGHAVTPAANSVSPISKLILTQYWINCDMRNIRFDALGKFGVVMADPPWDIHMNLPYETMKDKEMKALRVDVLQDDGLIFLWVTGRAMELGRECLKIWGYKRVEEIIWVKTNQLQRIIRTGRTGHWLNHSKEHCLVGIKGNPEINTKIDCDVIVSEVRETSRKPDEIYGLIERMSPGGRKIELYGRPLNCMPGWLTLGNQLPGVAIHEPELLDTFSYAYPDVDISQETMDKNRRIMRDQQELYSIYNSHIMPQPPFKIYTKY